MIGLKKTPYYAKRNAGIMCVPLAMAMVYQPRPQGLLRTWRVKNEKTLVKAVLNSIVIGLYI